MLVDVSEHKLSFQHIEGHTAYSEEGADFVSNYVLLDVVPSFCGRASTGEAPTLPWVSAKKIHPLETAERTDGRTNRGYTTT